MKQTESKRSMIEATELDTTTEEASTNGHDEKWKVFDDDQAFLRHILSKKPAEEIIEVPEWEVRILCRALNAESRIAVQQAAYDEQTKRVDYRKCFHMIMTSSCYNPTTGHKVFRESHRDTLMREQDGGAIERLALCILRLSGMLLSDSERTRKN